MAVGRSNQRFSVPDPMYMLAFDHRATLRALYPEADVSDLASAKMAVLDSLDLVPEDAAARQSLAFLVDEEYGAAAARAARERGLYVAVPVEASRTEILRVQYPDYRERYERLDPQCVKALVFYNPADDAGRKKTQVGLLREFGEVAREQGRDYLVEVLMTPTAAQLERGGGSSDSFRAGLFPELLATAIREMQDSGVEPDVWKVEGLETVDATEAVAAQATAGHRDGVRCLVLGSGRSPATVAGWLANASHVPTFSGLAVGRTVWREPLADLLSGRVTREAALDAMAASFTRLIRAFGRQPVSTHVGP